MSYGIKKLKYICILLFYPHLKNFFLQKKNIMYANKCFIHVC